MSNNSAQAVQTYLNAHELCRDVSAVAARALPEVSFLKPSQYLLCQVICSMGGRTRRMRQGGGMSPVIAFASKPANTGGSPLYGQTQSSDLAVSYVPGAPTP